MEFSILMSVYLREKPEFLQLAIKSVLSQKVMPKELVIVEDGPLTKELKAILDQLPLKKDKTTIKRVPLAENKGLGNALNEGLKHCTTEWIGRMDSDDYSIENRFEIILKELKEKKSNIDVIGSHIIEFDSESLKDTGYRNVYLNHEEILKDFRNRNPMNHVSVFIKRKSILKVGGYRNFLFFEDYDLWARMAAQGMIFRNIDKSLVKVRVGKDMIGRRRGFFYMKQEIKMQINLLKLGLSPTHHVLKNIFIRGLGRLLPRFILIKLYKLNRTP